MFIIQNKNKKIYERRKNLIIRMKVFIKKIPSYSYMLYSYNYFQKLVICGIMIFIISGLNLIANSDSSFSQVNSSSSSSTPISPPNSNQQTGESMGSTNRDAILSYQQGNKFFNAKDYAQAVTSYKNAIKLDPQWAAPLIKEGNAYYELGNYTIAIESYDKAFVLLGNLDEQVKSLNKNTGPKPYWLNVWFDKGEALAKLKKFEEALTSFDKAISLEPKWDKPWFNKGKIFYDLGKYPDAKQFLEHALSLNSDPKTSALIETVNAKMQ